ncbi:protein transport protein SEC23 [Enteropsectra breve]|nr:protein transport protein SEC23 [Enteropsectra breve]
MSQTIESIEEKDGIRMTWNVWPVTLSMNEIVPIACMYNLAQDALVLPHEPIFCHGCQSILCPQSIIDYGSFTWSCLFCNYKNSFPAYARNISPENLLPELIAENTTVEYVLNRTVSFPTVFFFMIDRCTYDEQRHTLMKDGLKRAFAHLPSDARIGILFFGTNIELVMFGSSEIETRFVFSGRQKYTKDDINKLHISDVRSFLVSKEEKEKEIYDFIDSMKQDPFPCLSGHRQMRCTGAALSLAVSLFEGAFTDATVKIVIFTQGPCTIGPGKVARYEKSSESAEPLNLDEALNFYTEVAEKINTMGHSVDIIAETIADIGVEQIKPVITMNGGSLIMAQDFDERIKMDSIDKIFAKDENDTMKQVFNLKMQVKTSANLSFKGVIGEGRPLGSGWKVGAALPTSNITVLLENNTNARNSSYGYVQLVTQYQTSNRCIKTRVTTFSRIFTDDRNRLLMGFDQEAACVFQARAFSKKGFQNVMDCESAIDKNLIKFTKRYGNFERGNPLSVSLPESMNYYINFMFFFRRSLLVQNDGISPDEASYFQLLLFKFRVNDVLKMIKPSLISFHYQGDIMPVELDTSSLSPESILILDTFHNVLLWRGLYVENWVKEGLHESPEYEFFKNVISEADGYVKLLLDRVPAPQYKETCEGKSQERILLHYMNPGHQGALNTEKIDYGKFYDTLCRYIVRLE